MNKDTLFSFAQARFCSIRENKSFIADPDYFKFPLPLPDHKANAFVIVNNGKIKEIEIHYENGVIQTVRPD
ncbi:MAG: hypothetical protein AB1442_03645 [Nitrospirota bacterium]